MEMELPVEWLMNIITFDSHRCFTYTSDAMTSSLGQFRAIQNQENEMKWKNGYHANETKHDTRLLDA